MKENWYALIMAIINNMTPEQSFLLLEDNRNPRYNSTITDLDILDMIELKKTDTYKEIGYMYGITASAAYRRIKNYKERVGLVNVKLQ